MPDMAASALYKLEDGERYLSNCFPVRTFLCHKEGAGHWLEAHRESVEQRNKYSQTRKNKLKNAGADEPEGATSDTGNTLDGALLIKLHCVEKPSDLCVVDISQRRLTSVTQEDLKEFDSVVYVDASVNSLSIGLFSSFSSLRELDLSLNGCCNMTFNADNFPHLEVLDLSYNRLSEGDIVSVGRLQRLTVLHLSGNGLCRLPPNLGASRRHADPATATEPHGLPFGALEVLMLDHNRLSSDVFHSLANLRRLRHLNLQDNYISEIPYLQPNGALNQFDQRQTDPNPNLAQTETETYQDYFLRISQPVRYGCGEEDDRTANSEQNNLPMTELQYLSLAHNKIAEEESLLAAALFPKLGEIVIHSNPLTTQRSGDPPLLTCLLNQRLGVKIKRHDKTEVRRPSVTLPDSFKQKVRKKGPKVAERPLTELSETKDPDLRTQRRSRRSSPAKAEQTETNSKRDAAEVCVDEADEAETEPLFVTQAADLSNMLTQTSDEKTGKKHSAAIPGTFKDDGIFTDADRTADVVEATGTNENVRMLERTLKNLIVHGDFRIEPKHQRKRLHTVKQKRIEKLPPVTSVRKAGGEKAPEVKCNNSSALDGPRVNKQVYDEALLLLNDMRRNYKMVHAKTLEEALSMERRSTCDQDNAN